VNVEEQELRPRPQRMREIITPDTRVLVIREMKRKLKRLERSKPLMKLIHDKGQGKVRVRKNLKLGGLKYLQGPQPGNEDAHTAS